MLYKKNRNQAFQVGEIVRTTLEEYPLEYKVRHYNAGWDEYYLETSEGELVGCIFSKSDLERVPCTK